MNSSRAQLLLIFFGCVALLVVMIAVPLPIASNLDFSQVYITNRALLQGNTIYGPLEKIGDLPTSVISDRQPLANPPWHYTLLLPLGVISPWLAARVWAWINMLLILSAGILLTQRSSRRARALTLLAVLLSAPVQAQLVTGQFTLVLLGICALAPPLEQSGRLILLGCVLALATDKPHLGLPIVAGIFLWLWSRKRSYVAPTLTSWVISIAALLGYSLLIDPTIPHYYASSVSALTSHEVNRVCDTCSSLSLAIQSLLPNTESSPWMARFLVAIPLGLSLLYPCIRWAPDLGIYMAGLMCSTILSAPYIRNYDYVLLIFPVVTILFHPLRTTLSPRVRALTLTCLLLGSLSAGILPYLTSRESHRLYLWTSAMFVYVACLCTLAGARSSTRN